MASASGNGIVQRIALEGGEDIKKTLAEIARAGKEAFQEIEKAAEGKDRLGKAGDAFKKIGADLAELGKAVGPPQKLAAAISRSAAQGAYQSRDADRALIVAGLPPTNHRRLHAMAR